MIDNVFDILIGSLAFGLLFVPLGYVVVDFLGALV